MIAAIVVLLSIQSVRRPSGRSSNVSLKIMKDSSTLAIPSQIHCLDRLTLVSIVRITENLTPDSIREQFEVNVLDS
ncbi:MAG: hypothetical protein KME27_08710 [Lyngbya sp. HA4199-MV5]|jgi:hypothetical protein|nr:hypothetical protein [Lyngbya sp. HA4199-MV5]